MWKLVTGGLAAICLALPAAAQELDEARVRELVLDTIRENPEVVMEALSALQQQQQQQQAQATEEYLRQNQQAMVEGAPILGSPEGDVTVVEFFDYNCPYCKRAAAEVEALIESDPNVRVVMREWPILGDGSVVAARAALAAREQGLYEEFHTAMMAEQGRATEDSVMRVAEEVGLNIQQLQEDMQAPEVAEHIATSMELTRALGLNGTPSFVIGDQLVPGYVEAAELKELVEQAREEG